MDASRFDALVRSLDLPAPRRAALGVVGGGLGALLTRLGIEDAEAKKKHKKKKRKKKTCKPCQIKKKGKCKGPKPDGTPCGGENVCQGSQCVPPAPSCDPLCVPPEECVDGECVPPPPSCEPPCEPPDECIEGVCVPPTPTCEPPCVFPEECVAGVCSCPSAQECEGGLCCAAEPICHPDGACNCGGVLCTCPPDEDFCQAGQFRRCCLPDDDCDPVLGCVTDTCVTGNDFCHRAEWALCNPEIPCGCFVKAENGTPVCAFAPLFACPPASECATDAGCAPGEVCVDVSCCNPGGGQIGLCLALCQEP